MSSRSPLRCLAYQRCHSAGNILPGRIHAALRRAARHKENSTQALYPSALFSYGAPGAIRTHGLWLRRPTLYPAELRAHKICLDMPTRLCCQGRSLRPALPPGTDTCRDEPELLRGITGHLPHAICMALFCQVCMTEAAWRVSPVGRQGEEQCQTSRLQQIHHQRCSHSPLGSQTRLTAQLCATFL